ncbi:MAG: hypothetical protein IJ360_01850 [Clostridia bacterium]|nr:hypothetical protein [Clostridia bacterium]
MNNTNKSKDSELLQDIYSNVKMGSESIINLLPKVNDTALKSMMTTQLDTYEKYAKRVRDQLTAQGITPKEPNPISKISSKIGMEMKSLQDSTTSHMAEMMVQGSTMDVTDLLQKVSAYEKLPECKNSVSLAKEIVAFEERNIEKMKDFL